MYIPSVGYLLVNRSSRLSLTLSFRLPTGLTEITIGEPKPKPKPEREPQDPLQKTSPDVPLRRLAYLNKPEIPVLFAGSLAAIVNDVTYPIFGVQSSTIKILHEPPHELSKDSKFWALMFVAFGMASFVAYPAQACFFVVAGCKLIRKIRSLCFDKVTNMEVGWFNKPENSSGAIGARLSATVRTLVGDKLGQLVQDGASAISGLIIAFVACWQLAFIILALIPLEAANGYVQTMFLSGFSSDAKAMYEDMYEDASQVATDAVGSIRTVVSFCAEEKIIELYRKKCEGPKKTGIRQGLVSGTWFGITSDVLFFVYAVSLYAGALFVAQGITTFENVYRVFFALTMAAISISQSSSVASDSYKSIFAILDRKPEIDSDYISMTLVAFLDERGVTFDL